MIQCCTFKEDDESCYDCAFICSSQDDFLFSVSIVSGLACVILAVIKFMLGKVLTSRALITDGRCSDTAAIEG